MMSGSKAPDYDTYGLLRTTCSHNPTQRSKKAAKYITKSNIESGVAYTIRELLKRQGGKADGENIRNL